MRAVAFCLLALVVAASARDFPAARNLLQATALNCEADSSATLTLDGSGSGFAQGTAYCQALADAEKVVKEEVEKYFEKFDADSSNGQCTKAEADATVTGVAKAFASAFTSVSTKVDIQGTGEACAAGFAAGDALAVSLVQVYLDVSLQLIEAKYPTRGYHEDVKNALDKVDSATGRAKGAASAAVIATAWAAATSEACTTGGFKSDLQDALVKSTTTATAELWATVVVELCSNFDDANKDELKEWAEETSKSFSEIAGEVDVEGETVIETTEGGAASGVAQEIPVCSTVKGICCSANNKERDICSCGSGCSMSKSDGDDGRVVWKDDSTGDSCFCS